MPDVRTTPTHPRAPGGEGRAMVPTTVGPDGVDQITGRYLERRTGEAFAEQVLRADAQACTEPDIPTKPTHPHDRSTT